VIKILYSFLVSAAVTIGLTISCLILKRDYNDEQLNKFDKKFRAWICRPLRQAYDNDAMDRWADRLYAVILSLSDSQLVTGIAMLASAVKLLNDGEVVVYNFNIVADLAWFSSNTHLLALLVIRTYSGSSKKRVNNTSPVNNWAVFTNSDVLRYTRLSLMVVLAVLLVYVSYLSGAYNLYDNLNCPMKCLANMKKGGTPLQWTIVNTFFVLWSYPPAIVQNIPIVLRIWLRLRGKIQQWHDDVLRGPNSRLKANAVLKEIYLLLAYAIIWGWNFFASEFETVLEITGWFLYGVIGVIKDRNLAKTCQFPDGTPCMSQDEWEKQNQFGFGQLMPLFLLALPVLTFIEAWDKKGH